MKKVLALFLAVVMMLSAVIISTNASELSSESVALTDVSVSNADVSYDSYLNAVKVTPNTSGEVSLTITKSGSFSKIALWVPATAADDALTIYASGAPIVVNSSHKFSIISVTNSTSVELKYTPTDAYSIYVSAVGTDKDEVDVLANGTLSNYTEDELICDTYDVEKYTEYVWDSELIYNESYFPVKEADGSFAPIQLAYDVDRIVSVQSFSLKTEYVYGVDYTIVDGKLQLLAETSVSTVNYSQIYSDTQTSWWKTLGGSYQYCGQAALLLYGYINITYTTRDTWDGAIPEAKSFLLPNTLEKLENGENLKILAMGDSISAGANASANQGVEPYCDIWHTIVAKELRNRYPDATIENKTIAQGGATAIYAVEHMSELITYQPDLIMLEFGVNECMQGDSPTADGNYIDILTTTINSIHENLPEAEIILVGLTISNNNFFPEQWWFDYSDALYTLETTGVAVADVTGVYQYLLTQKRYIDMAGDNLCHPNDYGMRLMAQPVLRLFDSATTESYIEGLASRITKYAFEDLYLEAEWAQIQEIESAASEAIAECATVDAARTTYISYAAQLNQIKVATEVEAEANIDVTNLVFNSQRATDVISEYGNTSRKYDADLNSVVLTSIARKTRPQTFIVVDYTSENSEVKAEDYSSVVITVAIPSTNATSSYSTLTFTLSNGSTSTYKIEPAARDGKFYSYVVDLSEDEAWTGRVLSGKLVTFAATASGDQCIINSIILCSDAEKAEDVAVERAYNANKSNYVAVTNLIDSAETASMLNSAIGDGECYLVGDNNDDGKITSKDCINLRKYIAEAEVDVNEGNLDVDGDGEITSADVTTMRRILAGILEAELIDLSKSADVSYSDSQQAAKIVATVDNPKIAVDLSACDYSADIYKYVSLCAKNADETEMNVIITIVTEDVEISDTVTIGSGNQFTADTAKFTEATGKILSISFQFEVSNNTVIYFDSFVLTPTISQAQNAEIVRLGAANLI